MVRIKRLWGTTWEEIPFDRLWEEINRWPKSTFEVKLPCKHKSYVFRDGEKRCEKCDDLLEVVSYRD